MLNNNLKLSLPVFWQSKNESVSNIPDMKEGVFLAKRDVGSEAFGCVLLKAPEHLVFPRLVLAVQRNVHNRNSFRARPWLVLLVPNNLPKDRTVTINIISSP